MKTSCLLKTLALLLLGSVVGDALSAESLPPFPLSTLQDEVVIRSPSHRVLLSPVREINDQIRSNVIARVPVEGRGQLFEVIADSSRSEAREHYLGVLQSRNAVMLFRCSGVECGRSNVWANQIFGQPTLYGRDADQDYLAAATVDEAGQRWLTTVYTVTRGNHREYLWVEHLALGAGAVVPGLSEEPSRILGPMVIRWSGGVTYRFDWTANDRRKLNEWASEPSTKVILTSYTALEQGETLESARERAKAAGDSLAAVLGKTGISREQIEVLPVGPVIRFSDPERQGDRVEIVVIRR